MYVLVVFAADHNVVYRYYHILATLKGAGVYGVYGPNTKHEI